MTYNEFIDKCKARYIDENTYTEKHHIIPKCMGGTNDESNLITLTAQEHYIAHKLLAQENPDNNKIQFAFLMMSSNNKNKNLERDYIISEEEYAVAKKNFSDSQTGEKNHNYGKCGELNSFYGKKHSEEDKKKMRKKKTFKNDNNPKRKKVICLTTNIIYKSITEAHKLTGISASCICYCCKNKYKYAGKLSDGTELSWAYYDEKEGE